MGRVNLTRLSHTSVDFVEEEDRIPVLEARTMAHDIGGIALWAAIIAPGTSLELSTRRNGAASVALVAD